MQRLRTFLAVADALHFGRAAASLRISQPSVSQQVAGLERDLDCRLFDRMPGGVSLTQAGRDLAGRVGTAIRELDGAVNDFLREHGHHRRLRLGLLSSLSSSLIPTTLSTLDWDGAEVALVEASLTLLMQRLRGGELDVAFCYSSGAMEAFDDLQMLELDRRPVCVALPIGDPLAEFESVSWRDLAARPWIMPSASRQYRDDMAERFHSRGLRVNIVAEATTLSGQLALVAAGIGLTFTSPWASIPHSLTVRPVAESSEELILLAVHGAEVVDALTAAVIDAVREQANASR